MGAPRPADLRNDQPKPVEWAIPCPVGHCLARPGARCTTPTGRSITGGSHPSRLDAWLVRQHGGTAPAA